MSKPLASLLNVGQIHKRTFDEQTGAIRIIPAKEMEMAISLSADEGDSVQVVSKTITVKQTITKDSGEIVIQPISCVGLNKFQLSSNTIEAASNTTLNIELSPSDTDDVWFCINTFSAKNSVGISSGLIVDGIGRRLRVRSNVTLIEGSVDLYLVGQA